VEIKYGANLYLAKIVLRQQCFLNRHLNRGEFWSLKLSNHL